MLAVYVCLTKIVNLHNHLEVEVQHCLQNLSVDVEVGIVNLQHEFLFVLFNQEHLRFACILTQDLYTLVVLTFQYKYAVINFIALHFLLKRPLSIAGRRDNRDINTRTSLWLRLCRLGCSHGSAKIATA